MRKFSNTVSVTCRCLRNIGGLSFPPCLFILILYCLLRLPGLSGKKLSLSALGFKPGSVHHCGVTDLLKEFLRLQIKKLCFASVKLLLGKKKKTKKLTMKSLIQGDTNSPCFSCGNRSFSVARVHLTLWIEGINPNTCQKIPFSETFLLSEATMFILEHNLHKYSSLLCVSLIDG